MPSTTRGPQHSRASRLAAVALSVVISALPIAGVAAAASGSTSAGRTTAMSIKGYAFAMPTLNVDVGDSVTWTNLDAAPHDVTTTKAPLAFKSPLLKANESWTYTFAKPGTYGYVCSVHPNMVASVVAAPAARPARPDKPVAAPQSATVAASQTATASQSTKRTATAENTAGSRIETKATAATAKTTKDAAPAEGATKAATTQKVAKPAKAAIVKAQPATESALPVTAALPAAAPTQPVVQAAPVSDKLDLDTEVLAGGLAVAIAVLSLLILGTRGRRT